ncbi:MAG TPA: DegV family protein, partial [Anaerolineales bacterium]|nr:DegV family protein [Anaerolineales bacterium]
MSQKVAIVTDSTSYIPPELAQQYNIRVIPQTLIWGEETFRDGIDIQPTEFYTRLATAKVMPTTSQATVQSFQNVFTELLDEGHQVLAVLLSEQLSGTLDSARQAQAEFPTGAPIALFDSRTTAMALGFLA